MSAVSLTVLKSRQKQKRNQPTNRQSMEGKGIEGKEGYYPNPVGRSDPAGMPGMPMMGRK